LCPISPLPLLPLGGEIEGSRDREIERERERERKKEREK